MKKLILTLLLGASAAVCQVPSPQIPLTGNIGAGGLFPLFNSGTINYTSDANLTMTYPQTSAYFIKITSGVSLTATRNLVAPLTIGNIYVVENLTTGAQSIQVIGTTGTGVTVPNGSAVVVVSDGTNYVSAGSSGGGGSGLNQLTGDVLAGPGTGSQVATLPTVNTGPGACGDSTHVCVPTTNGKGQVISQTATAIASTTVNGQTCTPGSSCTVATAVTSTQFYISATCVGGVAFSAAVSFYDNNSPIPQCINSGTSSDANLNFNLVPAQPQYAEFKVALPAFWTGTGIELLFDSNINTGNFTWNIQTACPANSLSTPGNPTYGTASTLLSTTPFVVGEQNGAIFSSVAANSVNSCPATGTTTPSVLYIRVFVTSGTATGSTSVAGLTGIIVNTSRSQ